MRVASQERFRIVAEDEFFQGVGLDWTGAAVRTSRGGRRRRLTGVAMLIGAVGATAGVSATSLTSRAPHPLRPGVIPTLPRAQRSAGAPRARDLVASVALLARRHDGLSRGRGSVRRPALAVHATRAVHAGNIVRRSSHMRHPRLRATRPRIPVAIDAVRPVAAEPAIARRELDTTTAGALRPRARESEFGFER